MGQEQSYTHSSVSQVRQYKDKYDEPYRSSVDFRTSEYDKDYKRHRRSADSFNSDNSSTESSGYRSGSSAYDYRSDRSSKSDYYCTSLYKNEHYKDVNKEIYKPVKLHKEKRYNTLQLFDDKAELKNTRMKSYLSENEKAALTATSTKKSGIRNYTPKILSEEEQRKQSKHWI